MDFYFEYLRTTTKDLRVLIHQEIVNNYKEDDYECKDPTPSINDFASLVHNIITLVFSPLLSSDQPMTNGLCSLLTVEKRPEKRRKTTAQEIVLTELTTTHTHTQTHTQRAPNKKATATESDWRCPHANRTLRSRCGTANLNVISTDRVITAPPAITNHHHRLFFARAALSAHARTRPSVSCVVIRYRLCVFFCPSVF